MMDIVIPYKLSKSQELEYAVKSCKNLEHDRIIVVGDKPDLEVTYWKPSIVRYAMLSPHHDVIAKLNYVLSKDISDDFILMNDDFFVLKTTDIKPKHRGTLDQHIAGRRFEDSYTKSLRKTNEYLKSVGIKHPLSYELHTPMVFNKHKLKALYEQILPNIDKGGVLLTRSLYGNIYKVGGTEMKDVKNPDIFRGKIFLSTSDKSFEQEIGYYIREVLK